MVYALSEKRRDLLSVLFVTCFTFDALGTALMYTFCALVASDVFSVLRVMVC